MSTIEEKLWIPAKWDEEKKCWIPLPEEARKIIPSIDDKRIEKWIDEYTVELIIEEIYRPSRAQGFVGRAGTRIPPGKPLRPTKLREVVLYIDYVERDKFYIPVTLLSERCISTLADLLSSYVTAYLENADTCVRKVYFDAYDMLKFLKGEKVEPINLESVDIDVEYIEVQLTNNEVEGWLLEPGKTYRIVTEWVNIPNDMIAKDVKLRSSYRRLGWDGHPSNIEPGFQGHIIFTIYSLPDASPLIVEKGARIITMRLYKLEKPASGYRGQFQGV